ncbi:hypothetical protein [Chryseobacterium vrystaatense]|uniref:Nuclear transport factor 2 family protein n=1 Tax=Chryseobacterium vrystaatense TaxID=307480 RepID=A0A1M5DW12_9FLAO|nr:hypothetical protein [Chryseobacterium vrystaatense]KFF23730.1 hypothetical protein IW16_26235 [Chryseobacterium vrystaatense]SHF71012.1 hypothetical protein SAMN02787073_2732 [Chryseobacterium vrystaatense]
MKTITAVLILFLLVSCVSQDQKDKEQIEQTVSKYWNAVRDNDMKAYKNLFDESEDYSGAMQADLYFLHKNYAKINLNNVLLKDFKIKDTTVIFAGNKQKYVQYVIAKKNDPNNLTKDLVITLMFYKPIGFNKIYNLAPLKNHIGWEKD